MPGIWQGTKNAFKELGIKGWAKTGFSAASGALGAGWNNPYGRAGMIGAGIGAGWGAVSDDTSVLGGAIGGGLAGAGGRGAFRYGKAGLRGLLNAPKGAGWQGAQAAMSRRLDRDIRDFHTSGTSLQSNLGVRRLARTVKGWGDGHRERLVRPLPG